jgi:hypothetical protein
MDWPLFLLVALAALAWVMVFVTRRVVGRRTAEKVDGEEIQEEELSAVQQAVELSIAEKIVGLFWPK